MHVLVYERIVERIFDGVCAAGDRLPTEDELARQFEVSRVTVRNALQKLRDNRLIVSVQGSGNYVGGSPFDGTDAVLANLKAASYRDIVAFRMALETQAAALAAHHRTDEHVLTLQSLTAIPDTMDTSSLAGVIELRLRDLRFHETIWQAAGNMIMSALLESLVPIFMMHWLRRKDDLGKPFDSLVEQVHNEHSAIADAIVLGDPQAARTAMRTHLQRLQDDEDAMQNNLFG